MPYSDQFFIFTFELKKYFLILKMAEELIGNLGYGTQSIKNSSNVFSLEIVNLYLGKVYKEEQLAKLNKEEVENLFNN